MNLSGYERLDLFMRPTPMHELSRLQRALGCRSRILIKRDDLTAVGLGGNKVRKLCYVMAEARAQCADVIITWAGVQSNHCRQTLAVAKHLGMDCHLILEGDEPNNYQGNTLIFSLLGAKMHFVDQGEGGNFATELAEDLKRAGQKPYVVPIGASNALGSLGYVESVCEVSEQAKIMGLNLSDAFLATGSAGTQAGAIVGAYESSSGIRIHGVSVSRSRAEQQTKVAALANDTFKYLGSSHTVQPCNISVFDEYYEEYGKTTEASIAAIRLLGELEAILLDPVYTGKAMAGMIDLLRRGAFDESEAVLFFHTGGSPALFAYADAFFDKKG